MKPILPYATPGFINNTNKTNLLVAFKRRTGCLILFFYLAGMNPLIAQNEAPVLTCSPTYIENIGIQCGINVDFTLATATGFPTPAITYSHEPGSYFPLGTTIVTATATNVEGSDQCTFSVRVDGGDPNAIICNPVITAEADPFNCSAVVHYALPKYVDNCNSCTVPFKIPFFDNVGWFEGHNYVVSNYSATWENANAAAIALGGHLVIVNSGDENAFLKSNVGNLEFWMGGFQNHSNPAYAEPGSGWEWTDGTPFMYTNWNNGEPNNAFGNEDHLVMYSWSGVWNDRNAEASLRFVVEFDCIGSYGLELVSGLHSGSSFPVGVTTNTYHLFTTGGISTTCSIEVKVQDHTLPVITCMPDITVEAAPNASGATVQFTDRTGHLFASGAYDMGLYEFDISNPSVIISSKTIVPNTGNYSNTTGMAMDPVSGEVYVILHNFGATRALAKLDITTGQATVIGNIDYFASLAFSSDGTLYGVTGNNAAPYNSLFIIDKNNGTATFKVPLGGGGNGHALAFNPDDGFLYHFSRYFMERINLLNFDITNIPVSGWFTIESPTTATYLHEGNFMLCYWDSYWLNVNETGVGSSIVQPDIIAKGLFKDGEGYGITAKDNCNVSISQTAGLPSGSFFPVGTTINTFVATDASGNTSTCSIKVTVVGDNLPPTVSCPGNKSVNANHAGCTYKQTGTGWDATATGDCSGITIKYTLSGATTSSEDAYTSLVDVVFNTGVTTVTAYAEDACGNQSVPCSFTVTVANTLTATCTTTNTEMYFGYPGDQTAVVTATASGGTGPYTIRLTMKKIENNIAYERPLLCNQVNDAGDEKWIPGAGGTTVNNTCPAHPGLATLAPVSTKTNCTSYGVTLTLMAKATIIATITDANGCIATCSTYVYGEDVRCFAGKSNISKVTLCHRTGSTKNPCVSICVDENAVQSHLDHGDFFGKCNASCTPPNPSAHTLVTIPVQDETVEKPVTALDVKVLNNPAGSSTPFRVKVLSNNLVDNIRVRVTEVTGKPIEIISTLRSGQTVDIGKAYVPGMYFMELQQGNQRKVVKLVKQ